MSVRLFNKRILIITNHYLGNNAGGSFASQAYINAFAKLFTSTTLLFPVKSEADYKLRIDQSVRLIPILDNRSYIRKGIDIYRGVIHRFRTEGRIRIMSKEYDTIVFDTSIVSSGLVETAIDEGLEIMAIHHNVERDYYLANPPSFLVRTPLLHLIDDAEKVLFRNSNLNITLTNADRDRLTYLYSDKSDYSAQVGGIFESSNRFKDNAGNTIKDTNILKPWNGKDNMEFCITGSLLFRQSDESIRRFIINQWPLLRRNIPNSSLVIAGRDPSSKLKRLCKTTPNITLIANPQEISGIIIGCDYYISPVDIGSGLKLRNMDALRLGKPAIVHEVSARGYEMLEDSGIVFSYNASTFEETLKKVIQTRFDSNEITNLYKKTFSFNSGVKRLQSILTNYYGA